MNVWIDYFLLFFLDFVSPVKEVNCIFSQVLNVTNVSILLNHSIITFLPFLIPWWFHLHHYQEFFLNYLHILLFTIKLNHHLYLICKGVWDQVAHQMCAIKLILPISQSIVSRLQACSLMFLFAFCKLMSDSYFVGNLTWQNEGHIFPISPMIFEDFFTSMHLVTNAAVINSELEITFLGFLFLNKI